MAPRTTQVTPVDVRRVVIALESKGEAATIAAVRAMLGGGSTRIISETLKSHKVMEERALILAGNIKTCDLFDIVVREDQAPTNASVQDEVAGLLARFFGNHNNPTTMTLREYVEAGFIEAELIEEDIDAQIDTLYDVTRDESGEREFEKELWLRAYSHAVRNLDRKEMAILFAEDWLELNG